MSDGESDDSQPDEVVVDQHEAEEAEGQDAASRLPSSTSTRKPSRPVSMASRASGWKDISDAASIKTETTDGDTNDLLGTTTDPPKGCWHAFSKCIGGMWATREMDTSRDREIYVRTTIRELVVYIIFLTVLCILTFGMASSTNYYYTQVMVKLFKDIDDVGQVTDFWDFMEGGLLDGLYWEYKYNDGGNKKFICPGGEEATGPCPLEPSDRNILYENRLIGLPRIRQLRVKNDSCAVFEDFQKAIRVCYDTYSEDIEDKEPFGNGYRKHTSADAWRYMSAEETSGTPYNGEITSYSGAGSVQDLHSLKNESLAIVKELKEGLWIGRGTRFIAIDFTVYNANINLFCITTLTFEFPATGGVIPLKNFQVVKLLRYLTAEEYFIMANEFIFIAFILYYIIEEALELKKHGIKYLFSVWNMLDIIVVVIAVVCVIFSIYSILVVTERLALLLENPDTFADFSFLGQWSKTNNSVVAICVFFSWIKLFKYISFNKTMTQLSSTISRCAKDVAGFGLMFSIIFFAFAQLGFLLFGTQVEDFSRFNSAIFTLLRTILGDFDFKGIEAADRVLGPLFFLSYVFFVFFVLLNMFLAIINDTYSEVKAEIATQRNDFEIGDYFKRGYNNVLGKMSGRNKNIDIENALKLAASDGQITYNEIRQNLKKLNFADLEIEMFFSRYDKDGNFEFDAEEAKEIFEDLDNNHVDIVGGRPPTAGRPKSGREARDQRRDRIMSASSRGNASTEEYDILDGRVNRMEKSIVSIVRKIDTVLGKLESLEKTKAKRKAAMTKILGTITDEDGADAANDDEKRSKMEAMVKEELSNWDEKDGSRPSTSDSARH